MPRLLAIAALLAVLVVLSGLARPGWAAEGGPGAESGVVGVLRVDGDGVTVESVVVRDGTSAEAVAARLDAQPGVVADVAVSFQLAAEPLQHHQWQLPRLQVEQAWTRSEGAGMVVAVLDTGVDATQPDLAGAVVPGVDLVDAGGDGATDPNGHGTAVAGIAAARVNGTGVAGIAPAVGIMPVRVLGADGTGNSADVAAGIVWAVDHGADVVNLSLGGRQSDRVLDAAVAHAIDAGIVVVAAAGNDGTDSVPVYPAALPDVLAVAATDRGDARANFSNGGDWIDLAAPGVDIAAPFPGARWGMGSGTSFAAPHVAAAAALVRGADPGLDGGTVAHLLTRTAQDIGDPGIDQATGAGLLDPVAALGIGVDEGVDGDGTEPAPPETPEPVAMVQRVGTDPDPVRSAVEISRTAFPAGASADRVVLGRDDVFADSLAGTALAGSAGPVLYTQGGPSGALRVETAAEITRVLAPGGRVWILGGPAALSAGTEEALRAAGWDVRRLAGASRVETAIAVAEQVDRRPSRVLLARSDQWADAVTGGAFAAEAGLPVLVTPPDALHPAVAAALAAQGGPEVVLLGGEAALSARVADQLGGAQRVAGSSRAGTAAAIASDLWGRRTGRPGDHVVAVEGWRDGSWAPALAAAVLAARRDAPQLLLDGSAAAPPPETAAYLAGLGYDGSRAATATLAGPDLGDGHADALRVYLGS